MKLHCYFLEFATALFAFTGDAGVEGYVIGCGSCGEDAAELQGEEVFVGFCCLGKGEVGGIFLGVCERRGRTFSDFDAVEFEVEYL